MNENDGQRDATRIDLTASKSVDDLDIRLEPIDASTVIQGLPQAGLMELLTYAEPVEVGVWEMSAGGCRDVEADEFLVVIAGSAVVTVNDGQPQLLKPGDMMRFRRGDRTTWTVKERIRKIYVTPAA